MSRSQLRISVAAIRLTRPRSSAWMPSTARPSDSDASMSGSPRKWRASRRWTASSPGHSVSRIRVTAMPAPACARRTRAARIGVADLEVAVRRCMKSNSAAGSAKSARAGSSAQIARNCRWNERVVVERTSCACSAGQDEGNGRLPYGRASEAPHRGQVRASRASRVGKEGARAEGRRGPGPTCGRAGSGLPQPRQVQVAGSAAMYSCPRVKRTCRWPERITPSRRPQEQRHWSGIIRPLRWRPARGRAVVVVASLSVLVG